jgi:hypothetical protein
MRGLPLNTLRAGLIVSLKVFPWHFFLDRNKEAHMKLAAQMYEEYGKPLETMEFPEVVGSTNTLCREFYPMRSREDAKKE